MKTLPAGFRRGMLKAALAAVMLPPASAAPAKQADAVVPVAEAAPTPYPGRKWSPPAPSYGIAVRKDIRVRMRDGVELPADVYLPADPRTGQPLPGKFPVLLTRNWYSNVSDLMAGADHPPGRGDYFVQRGYVFVSADVRGTGRSLDPGAYLDERDAWDGVDLVNWTTTLPESNGKVGLVGCSGLGTTVLNTASVIGPNSPVKAMIAACVPGDQYRDTYTENGVFSPSWAGLYGVAAGTLGPGMVPEFTRVYLDSLAKGDVAYYRDWWRGRSFVERAQRIADMGAPLLLWNGWDDTGFGGLELYAALQNAAHRRSPMAPLWPGMAVSGKYQLILGEWSHGKGLDYAIQLQWFDTWLKGIDTGLATATRTPIHVQDRVTRDWVNAASYPMTARNTVLYLGDGALTDAVPGPGEDRLDRAAGAALDYTGEPFGKPMRIAGPAAIGIEAWSNNSDAQFAFDLLDVAPDGSARPISHGMVLASMYDPDPVRSWRDKQGNPVRPYLRLQNEAPVEPGKRIRYEVQLAPTLWTMLAGHRLRLRIAPAAQPQDCRMGNRGCALRRDARDRLAGAVQTIRHGGATPSLISLPLVPEDAFPPVASMVPPTAKYALPLDW
ncbi:MAG TPA: CocE/NonD family hydrolase [Novosphingobium sp.]|nr:CocE/NonD family hydrolase [Novosphingobium sp.]